MASLNAPKGLIRPPPDIRAIVDKTAAFIGKMGDEFEARIQSQSGGDVSKFRFLNPSDPYHAYYKHKVLEARTGTSSSTTTTATTTTTTSAQSVSSSSSSSSISTTKSAATVEVVSNEHVSNTNNVVDVDSDQNQNSRKPPTTVEESNAQSVDNSNQSINPSSSSSSSSSSSNISVSVSAVLPNPLARALKTFESLSLAATSAPKPFYSVLTPIGITAAAADRMKLTAEFTATGGRRFLASLTSKEFNNPEFDFLRPSHAHFSYYTALVDAFAKVLTPPSSVVSKVEALADDSSSSYSFLESVVHEAEWMRLEEEKKRKEEDINASSAVQIDWHSFVVVETVELKDFVFVKEGWEGSGSRGINGGSLQQPGEEEEGDGDMDVEEEEEEMEVDTNEDGNEEFLNIRMDYKPSDQSTSTTTGLRESPSRSIHHASSSSGGGGGEVFLDPISGLSIPIDRANEHIKAQTLDPKAKQNRLRFEAKQSKTLFTTGEDVASNLKNLIGKKSADDGKTVSSLSNTKTTPIVEIGVEMPPTAKNGPAQKRPRTSDN